MRIVTAAAVVALSVVSACSSSHGSPTGGPPPATAPTTATGSNTGMSRIEPGAFPPVKVGHRVAEYVATGYLERDPAPPCEGPFWRWTDKAPTGTQILVGQDRTVDYLGTGSPALSTAAGIHVGSTLRQLRAAYGARLSTVLPDDYDGGWVSVRRGQAWIAFGLGARARITGSSPVKEIQVGRGRVLFAFQDAC